MVQAVSQHRPEAAGARRVGRLSAYEALSNVTADHQEAVRAIREQRDPKFIGR
jgi:hypothetical protein